MCSSTSQSPHDQHPTFQLWRGEQSTRVHAATPAARFFTVPLNPSHVLGLPSVPQFSRENHVLCAVSCGSCESE
eukprot:m.11880 g.11880  ORF g.11880 m.11880 type:complete len:74 (-) comp4483_c0_seq1:71-292(-)